MPARPRNHEIETESRRAFEQSVPSRWVVRPVDGDDYGVDREVEIFEDGTSTGLTFKVQLKGTDKSGSSVRAKRRTVHYWLSLDVPVLIVSFETRSGRMLGRWAHTIGADVTESAAEKVTIKLDPGFELDAGWTDGLAVDLRLVRELRRGVVPTPLPIRVDVDDVVQHSATQLRAEILRLSRECDWPMRPASAGEHAMSLHAAKDHASARLPLLWGSANWHLPLRWLDQYTAREVAQLLVLLAAAALAKVNQTASAELATAVGPGAPFWLVDDVGGRLGPILVERGHHDLLFEIVMSLSTLDSPEAVHAVETYQSILGDSLGKIDDAAFSEFSRTRRDHIAQLAADEPAEAARQLFNLASIHRVHRRDFATAVDLYREAGELAPQYRNDPLALSFIGGSLFEIGEYQESADSYREAIANGHPRQRLVPLLADSLMLAGKYKEASDQLATWNPAGEERDRVGIIRKAILDYVAALHDLAATGSQILCATHSPLLAATPGARLLEVGAWGLREVRWTDLELVAHWKRYLDEPMRYLRHVIDG